MATKETILSLQNVGIGFHRKSQNLTLLENLNLTVGKGDLIGIIGRNGSGKSTLIRSIVRLLHILSGEIRINSENLDDIHPNEFAQLLAYVSSGIEFSESMTVRELVSLGRFPYTNWIGRLSTEDKDLIDDSLFKVGINQLSERKLSEISDGERQKAMIARTLAQNTSIIVLDEPTAFLDIPSKYDIISLLHELTKKGKTVIYSTHDLNIALRFSDKIWLIDKNSIKDGSPEDLILNKTIASIFDSDKIHLNQMSGDFELRHHLNKVLCFNCDNPEIFYWTKQALQRSGYEIVSDSEKLIRLSAEINQGIINWKIKRFNENLYFQNIYEMLIELENSISNPGL